MIQYLSRFRSAARNGSGAAFLLLVALAPWSLILIATRAHAQVEPSSADVILQILGAVLTGAGVPAVIVGLITAGITFACRLVTRAEPMTLQWSLPTRTFTISIEAREPKPSPQG